MELNNNKTIPKVSKVNMFNYPEGYDECYWCDKVNKKEEMKMSREHNSIIYICKGCQPK